MNPKVDWSGKKYLVAQELGESIDIYFLKFNPVDESFHFYKRPHSDFDQEQTKKILAKKKRFLSSFLIRTLDQATSLNERNK